MQALTDIRACVFDAYGTLFDFASAARSCQADIGDDFDKLSALWRDKQLQYTWLRAVQNRHADFWQVTGDALDFAMETLGLQRADLRDRLMSLYLALDAFPEVPALLARLKGADLRLAILSNGTPRMLDAVVKNAKLDGLFDAVLSVEEVGIYKPDRRGVSACGRPARYPEGTHLLSVIQRLGCVCCVGIRDAGGLVQSLRTASRAPSRQSERRNQESRRASSSDRSAMNLLALPRDVPLMTETGISDPGITNMGHN